MKNKIALISVSDKTGIVSFAQELSKLGFTLVSTGGTKRTLSEANIPVISISDLTGFPEILDGRLKTLHPFVHGGILARRNEEEDLKQLENHGIKLIDLVVVNLYPFAKTVAKEGVTLEEAIENIDIGGPTMVRAAAKNYKHVAVVVNPLRYPQIIQELKENGNIGDDTRFNLAVEAFTHTAEYDSLISNWLQKKLPQAELFPETMVLSLKKIQNLRYGENPQLMAALYREENPSLSSLVKAKQIHGKELSFNNLNDLNAVWELIQEFTEPAAVIVKHTNPCGVAIGSDLYSAYCCAYEGDPVSAFGGIVGFNRPVDAKTAEEMNKIFLEAIIAPGYEDEALNLLKQKKDVRLLEAPLGYERPALDMKKIWGGLLVQEIDNEVINPSNWTCPTKLKPDEETLKDLVFAMKVVKHVKSNAIVLAKNGRTIGIGAGQMNRVGAAKIALEQAGDKAKGSVLASDAFFPFRDTVDEAAKKGIRAIVQPGGSLKDQDSIDACDEQGLIMLITGRRFFKH